MYEAHQPVAFFDSGLGGISVLRAAVRALPHENFLYYGDSANAPYGTKPREEIIRLSRCVMEKVLDMGAKAVVIACNTATSVAVQELRQMYPDRIIIGIEPAIKPAIERFACGNIVVMATETTLREKKFDELTETYAQTANIIKCPCPELVEFVERGELKGEAVEKAIADRLQGCEKIDAVVLGCTHFPFLKDAVRNVIGKKPMIFDGADGTAKETKRRLEEANLANHSEGRVMITNSLPQREMIERSEKLLNAT